MAGSIDRLLRAKRTHLLVPLYELNDVLVIVSPTGTTCPFIAPTSAVLDAWRAIVTTGATGAQHGGNVSCATLDDMTLGLAESELDTELTICSVGNESDPTFKNIDAQLTYFRDKNKADTGVFNLATQLSNAQGIRYGYVDRFGFKSTDAFAAGQDVFIYDAETNVPLDLAEDRGNLKIQQNPNPSGNVITAYTLLT